LLLQGNKLYFLDYFLNDPKKMQFLYDKVPKFWQECGPKCRPIPKHYKTAETNTKTDILAEILADTDTKTDNFRSLVKTNVHDNAE
jgi:hypothetical protein